MGNAGKSPLSAQEESYKKLAIMDGAKNFPLLAQRVYREALEKLQSGDVKQGKELLLYAVELWPDYADAYFTLAKITALRFDGESLLYFTRALKSLLKNFHYQSLFTVNAVLIMLLLVVALAGIYSTALAVKYLPFSAHKMRELLENKFKVSKPGLAAYLVLLLPFALFPGLVTGMAIVTVLSWLYMKRREKVLLVVITAAFVFMGFFASQLGWLGVLADPDSLTMKIAEANDAPGDYRLIRSLERTRAPDRELDMQRNLALGLLHLKNESFYSASDYLLRVAAGDRNNASAYINLGNLYYLQGKYEKALEGYRKAEAIDSLNAICQYNLAQAYIKMLLMAKSSVALQKAANLGIDEVKSSYNREALMAMEVFPAYFTNGTLWRLARREGKTREENSVLALLQPIIHFSFKTSAWILLAALLVAFILKRLVHPGHLTFQCSNCGDMTCGNCCNDDRGIILCSTCAASIEDVSSEKVIEALLRQCRQQAVVRRRKQTRLTTIWIPGVRNIYYDSFAKGVFLSLLFSFSLIELWARGFLIQDWRSIVLEHSSWKMFVPAALLAVSYLAALFSRTQHKMSPIAGMTGKKTVKDGKKAREVASI